MTGVRVIFNVPVRLDPPEAPGLSRVIAQILPGLETRHLTLANRARLLASAGTWFELPAAFAGADAVELALAIPNEAVELALFLEADRIGFGTDGLNQEHVDWAQATISAKKPSLAFEDLRRSGLLGALRPYATEAYGVPKSAIHVEQVRAHFLRYFQTQNICLSIVGNIDPSATLQAVRRTFGQILGPQRAEAGAGGSVKPTMFASTDTPERYRPPPLTQTARTPLPTATTEVMPNATTLRHIEDHSTPLVGARIRFILRNATYNPLLAQLAATELVLAQAEPHTPKEPEAEQSALGPELSGSGTAALELAARPEMMGDALRSLGESLRRATGETPALARSKLQVLDRWRPGERFLELDYVHWLGSLDPNDSRLGRELAPAALIESTTERDIQRFWQAVRERAEWHVSLVGPVSLSTARQLARAWVPSSWTRSAHARDGDVRHAMPRVLALDEPNAKRASLYAQWSIPRNPNARKLAMALEGLADAARQLGNVNAARPSNPTTQFELRFRSGVTSDSVTVAMENLDLRVIRQKIRELDGYFARLVERPDILQLMNLGARTVRRKQLAESGTPIKLLKRLDDCALSNVAGSRAFEAIRDLGLAQRDALAQFAKQLDLDSATFAVRGPASRIQDELSELITRRWLVMPAMTGANEANPREAQELAPARSLPAKSRVEISDRFAWSIRAFPRPAISVAFPNHGVEYGAKEMHENRAIAALGTRVAGASECTYSLRAFEIASGLRRLPAEERLALLPRWLADVGTDGPRQPVEFHGVPALETLASVDKRFRRTRIIAGDRNVIVLTLEANNEGALSTKDSHLFFESLQFYDPW